MELGIIERVALVTCGSRGISQAVAEVFSADGVHVAVAARLPEPVNAVAEECGGRGHPSDSASLEGRLRLARRSKGTLAR